jgi:hypothetical protein
MNYFIKILLAVLFFSNVYAAKLVRLETKDFGKQIAFVFHHQDDKNLQILKTGKRVIVKDDQEIELRQLNSSEFNKFAANLVVAKDKKSLSFALLLNDSSYHKIDGEKLTAIEFVLSKTQEKPTEDTDLNNVLIRKKGKEILIQFPLSGESGSAVFIKDNYLWVVFDGYKKFALSAKNNIFKSIQQLNDQDKTVVRLGIAGQKIAAINKSSKSLSIRLGAANIAAKEIPILPFEEDKKVLVNLRNAKIHKLRDENVGEDIYVLTVQENQKVDKKIDFGKYKLIQTIQGAAITTVNENFKIDQNEQGILLGVKGEQSVEKLVVDTNNIDVKGSLLPEWHQDFAKQKFLSSKMALETAITKSSTPNDAYDKTIQLANFYFLHEMYHESLGTLNIASIEYPEFFNKDLKAYFLTAVNLSLINRNLKSENIFKDISQKLVDLELPEFKLWHDYNQFKIHHSKSNFNLLDQFSVIDNYSDNLYFEVVFASLDSYLARDDFEAAEEVLSKVRQAKDPKIASNIMFYKAQVYSLKGQNNKAKDIYSLMLKDYKDNFNVVRATLALTKLKYLDKEISVDDAIGTLNDLRFSWRGDKLEKELLLDLADYYRQKGDKINLLRTYKYILDNCYADSFYDIKISAEINTLAKELFLIDRIEASFENASLFLEFKNYISNFDEDEKIKLQMARTMLNLGLYDSCIDTLKKTLIKAKDKDKIPLADLLAEAYIANDKPQDAIKILEETDAVNSSFNEYIKRSRVKANAFELLGQNDKALEYLKLDDSRESYDIKKRLYVKTNKWQQLIDLTEEDVLNSIQTRIGKGSEVNKDVMMLAIGYALLDKKPELESLIGYLKLNPDLQKSVQKLTSLTNTEDFNIADIQKFIDDYKKMF